MSARVGVSPALTLAALLALQASGGCARNIPPPCQGAQCATWPHVEVRFWKNDVGTQQRRYTGALCVQVAFDCPEEGRHSVWIEPQAPRCRTYLNTEGAEWLQVEGGRLNIPWPARCRGRQVEMFVTAQPNFAICSALDNHLVVADRQRLAADVVFQCR